MDPLAINPQAKSKKILIVEDEKPIAELYQLVISKAGFQVKIAPDGATGLQVLEAESFDMLLLDIMLPGINGLELLRQFKSKHPDSQMIVLLLTNLGQDAVIKEAFELGATGYLIKASLTPNQVLTEVNNAFAGKQSESWVKPV
ncbi:response regulator [Candidatus Daviesbacteria bacterium]|nr:response regulator [Candidatus Daviesbacteria bacterium]